MDTLFAPFRTSAADGLRLTLSFHKEAADAVLAQSKLVEKQLHAAMELNREALVTFQNASQAMGKVMLDAWKPAEKAAA